MAKEIAMARIKFDAEAQSHVFGPEDNSGRVRGVLWYGAADGHSMKLDDQDSIEIAGWTAGTNSGLGCFFWFGDQGLPVGTITVTTLGSGILVVFV